MRTLNLVLLPAALAVLASTAAAQSEVVLSGRVDLGVRNAPIDLSTSSKRDWQQAESSNARLNIAGREDLGGGNSAFFMLEHRFNATNGSVTDPNAFWKDKAWVGLASQSYGELKLGRLHSPQYGIGVAGRYEAFFGDSYASMGTRGARSANQWNNSVYYTTPTFLGGATAGVIVQDGTVIRERGVGGHLNYATGPLSVALTYQKEQDPGVIDARNAVNTWTLGAYYDFGPARLMSTYARSNDVNAADTGKETVFTLGARVPMGPGEFRTSYRRIDDTERGGTNDFSGDQDSTRFSVGYYYPFSKKTSINLSLVREKLTRRNVDGSVKSDFAGSGFEAALRVMF